MNFKKTGIKGLFPGISLLILIVWAGFFRDFIFRTINSILRAWDLEQDYFLPPALSFLENYEYDTLVALKWVLTILFAVIYMLITLLAMRLLFRGNYTRLSILTYVALTMLSGLFMLTGYLFSGFSERMYEFSRFIMGLAQSPVILMILIPAVLLIEKEKFKTGAE